MVAIVTGGSRGIGAETCLALAKNGVKVAVNGRDEAAIQSTLQAISAIDGQAVAAPADCARLSSVEALRDRIHVELGAPDFVVAFAGGGTGRPMPFDQITEEDWRSSINNNLTSTLFTLKCNSSGNDCSRFGKHREHGVGGRSGPRRGSCGLRRCQGRRHHAHAPPGARDGKEWH
jgi:NAD(P)-dependent dehydrogenase (short-subunit alcohol dehydrogenase family)